MPKLTLKDFDPKSGRFRQVISEATEEEIYAMLAHLGPAALPTLLEYLSDPRNSFEPTTPKSTKTTLTQFSTDRFNTNLVALINGVNWKLYNTDYLEPNSLKGLPALHRKIEQSSLDFSPNSKALFNPSQSGTPFIAHNFTAFHVDDFIQRNKQDQTHGLKRLKMIEATLQQTRKALIEAPTRKVATQKPATAATPNRVPYNRVDESLNVPHGIHENDSVNLPIQQVVPVIEPIQPEPEALSEDAQQQAIANIDVLLARTKAAQDALAPSASPPAMPKTIKNPDLSSLAEALAFKDTIAAAKSSAELMDLIKNMRVALRNPENYCNNEFTSNVVMLTFEFFNNENYQNPEVELALSNLYGEADYYRREPDNPAQKNIPYPGGFPREPQAIQRLLVGNEALSGKQVTTLISDIKQKMQSLEQSRAEVNKHDVKQRLEYYYSDIFEPKRRIMSKDLDEIRELAIRVKCAGAAGGKGSLECDQAILLLNQIRSAIPRTEYEKELESTPQERAVRSILKNLIHDLGGEVPEDKQRVENKA